MEKIAEKIQIGSNWAHSVCAYGYDDSKVQLIVDGREIWFETALQAAEHGDSCFGRKSLCGNQVAVCLVSVASQMKAIPYGWRGWDNPEAQ